MSLLDNEDEEHSEYLRNNSESPSVISSIEPKQPFPPLPADDLATTTLSSQNDEYVEEDDHDPTSPSHADIDAEDDADFQSHFPLEDQAFSDASSDSEEQSPEDGLSMHHPFRQSTSSLHGPNAFAPPFYNRPPTPLPPSPSLTSLLRPPFSTTTSRPTTPDSSDVETPNDTEAAVAKSARRATTVPRASPKVPTMENIVDEVANVAVIDGKGRRRPGGAAKMRPGATSYQIMGPQNRKVNWKEIWSEGTDAVLDVPVGGVCEVLYGQEREDDELFEEESTMS
ncbi:hypothetical protein AbraIFM66950_011737 [Aspergillus brasiliensis]|nr:hypothetical protein AbraIFM66950_011737 [Aspergillus brasiliensis]